MSSNFIDGVKRVPAWLGILFLCTSCVALVEKPLEIPWHQCYQPISDPQAAEFLITGIALLESECEGLSIQVQAENVLLRYSKKSETAAGYRIREYFSRTEIIDTGRFCIYVGVTPAHERFYYLLGHEIAHLTDPTRIDSPEMERFCNEFSRRLCEKEKRPFDSRWENRKWVLQPREQIK